MTAWWQGMPADARALLGMLVLLGIGAGIRALMRGDRITEVQRLADLDNAARTPVTRPMDLGGHVIPLFRDPAHDCEFCAPVYNGSADCGCAMPCEDPGCGALAWGAVSRTEEMEL